MTCDYSIRLTSTAPQFVSRTAFIPTEASKDTSGPVISGIVGVADVQLGDEAGQVRPPRPLLPRRPGVPSTTLGAGATNQSNGGIRTNATTSAVHRIHTALHGHVLALCEPAGIEADRETTMNRALKLLRQNHPAHG